MKKIVDAMARSTQIPPESLGPPGIKGLLHFVQNKQDEKRTDVDRLCDPSVRQFRIRATLSKNPQAAEHIDANIGPEDGSTYFLCPNLAARINAATSAGQFEIKKNSRGEMSFVESTCTAAGYLAARRQFLEALFLYLDHISYVANCPVFIGTVRIDDPANAITIITYEAPCRKVTVNSHISELFVEMAPVYAMYREAKNSHSDFYSFLCYYKILEGVLGHLRSDVFKTARNKRIKIKGARDVVPESVDISDRYKEYIGKRIKDFFDKVMTPKFRNAVAHFKTGDGKILNMSAPEHIDNYADIVLPCDLCVRTAIEGHEALLARLHSKGS
ncbi:methylamine utilization protein MauJ [Acidiferrobacter sp.]|jgi:hypothetical protein